MFVSLKARIWAALAALGAFLAGVSAIYGKGRSDANRMQQSRDDRAHIKERGKIDDEISGIGGTDADRISRLQSIHDRRGKR